MPRCCTSNYVTIARGCVVCVRSASYLVLTLALSSISSVCFWEGSSCSAIINSCSESDMTPCVERETKLNTCTCVVDAYVQKRPVVCVCVRFVCRPWPLKCEAVVYVHVHVHVIGKCEAITSFDGLIHLGVKTMCFFYPVTVRQQNPQPSTPINVVTGSINPV